jgi:enoyl-CoA hydratase
LGVIPGYGGTQRLPQLVGKGRAMELILTANMLSAQEALDCGLVNQVVAQTELLELAKSLAEKISKNSPVAIQHAIQAVNASFDKNQNGFAAEINSFGTCFGTADFKEGTTAFLEKRKPDFQGN